MSRSALRLLSLVMLAGIAGCVSKPAPPPPPPPQPAPLPPAPPPVARDWRDWPISPGDWAYRRDARGSLALFGRAGADADFLIRCDQGRKRIYLSRAGTAAAGTRMTLRTTAGDGALAAAPTGGTPPYAAAELAPTDPLLDRMAYSRGRFIVAVGGLPPLAIPSWPEFARVVEDCRD